VKTMSTHLSRFFRQRREARKLAFGDLARRLGYVNVTKGANKVIKFERDGQIRPDLFRKLTAVLEISTDDIRRCIEADKAEWERWADEPIEPHLVARIMPAVYSTKSIPPELQRSQEAMEEFASEFARERKWRVWLVLTKKTRVWFDEKGQRTGVTEDSFSESYGPFMRLGGKRFLLGLLNGNGPSPLRKSEGK
jgi:transcriptional regulator with XRE-family HTH domain